MTTVADLENAQYINLETFRKNGTGVKTPVWQVAEGGTLYVWTQADSWKVKRIRNNAHVRVCQSDARGNPESEWVDAEAKVLESADVQAAQHKRMVKKYGLFYRMFWLLSKIRRADYTVVAINPANSASS